MKSRFFVTNPCYWILTVASLLFLQSHCKVFEEDVDKNVILITLDTLRADYVSAYDPQQANTPHIDYYAKNGILFKNCYSPIPITAPAHAVIFYSLSPSALKFYNNGQILRDSRKTVSLPELFRKLGYKTAAFISLGVLRKRYGLGHGFQTYNDSLLNQRWYLTAQEVNEKVIPWLSENKESHFFLWIHYSDPHFPYAPPSLSPDLEVYLNGERTYEFCVQKVENISMKFPLKAGDNTIQFKVLNPFPPSRRDDFRVSLNNIEFIHSAPLQMDFEKTGFATRGEKRSLLLKDEGTIRIRNPGLQTELSIMTQGNITLFTSEKVDFYRREVEYMDHHIGVLTAELKELGLLDKSIIMLVGDHGEGLGEYRNPLGEDYFGHIHYLHGVYMKVPLLIFDPFSKKKVQEIKEIVSLQDIAPTIIDMMGWKKIPFHNGRNLFKVKASEHDILFTETYTPEAIHDRFAGLQYPWHLIFTPAKKKFELYNLEIDPQEKVDVFTENKDDKAVVALTKHVYDTAMEILKTKRDIPLDDKSLEMLKALGYIK